MKKDKIPTKTISFKEDFLDEYQFLLRMEKKYGNLSRFICMMIREYMNNHPEEKIIYSFLFYINNYFF